MLRSPLALAIGLIVLGCTGSGSSGTGGTAGRTMTGSGGRSVDAGASSSSGGAGDAGRGGAGATMAGDGSGGTGAAGVGGNADGGVGAGTGGRGPGGGGGRGGPAGTAGTAVGGAGGGASGAAGAGGGGASSGRCAGLAAVTGVYYLDASAGRDSNDGLTPATAWQSLAKANATTMQPGGALCFKAGGAWSGQLAPKGSGAAGAPVVVDQYGSGAKPKIAAGSADLDAVLLLNLAYWELNNLEVTNTKSAPGDLRGICVRGRDAGRLEHIYIRSSFVHDVSGVVNWIGGDAADDDPPWVKFETGWDASKRTGGIVVEVESQNGTKTWFDDVVIENNVVQDTSFGGIVFKQLDGGYGWGVRTSKSDSKFTPHTNVVIRGNFVSQTKATYGCNAIYLTGAQHAVVEGNVAKDAGTSAIEIYNSDDVRVQHNETFGTVRKAGGADSNGIDADRATTGAVIQYNYVHDNGDGILLCQIAFGDSIVRYNLIINNSRHGINLHSDKASTNQTYNNLVFYEGSGSANLIATSGDSSLLAAPYAISNNILHSTRATAMVASGSGTTYANNLFSGVGSVGGAAQTASAIFVNSATHPSGGASGPALAGLSGFQVKATSAAIDNGAAISGNGGVDFWGNPLYKGPPDIGPFEAP